jgi:outer membrane protein
MMGAAMEWNDRRESLRRNTLMRLTPSFITLVLLAFPGRIHAGDLLDAYYDARVGNPSLLRSDSLRRAVREEIGIARASLLPQISARSEWIEKRPGGNLSYGGYVRKRTQSVTISQPVLDFSRHSRLRAARSSSHAENATYEAAHQQLLTRVATAYFQVLTNDDALTFAKANEQALARQLEQAQQRFDVGLSAITDVQDAKAQHDTSVAAVITAENTLADSREALTQITGKPADNLKKLREQLPMDAPTPNDPKAWVAEAVKSSPSILAAQYSVDSSEHSISSARAGHLPTIDASLGYNKSTAWAQNGGVGSAATAGTLGSSTGSNGRGATSVGLTLNVPIFSGGLTQSRVRQSIYQRDAAQDSLESVRRQVVRDTLNFYRSVVAGISKVGATKAAVESTESARDATQAGFEVGTRTIVDVLIAQQNLTQSLSDYSQARHQFILDKLLLKQTAGTVDIKDLEAVNSLLQ